MKKNISTFLWVLFLTSIMAGSAMALSIDLVTTQTDIAVGDSFGVEVWVNQEDATGGLLAFGFDADMGGGDYFSCTGYTLGAMFEEDFSVSDYYSGMAYNDIRDDSVLLATLNFIATDDGTQTVSIDGTNDPNDSFDIYGLMYVFEDSMVDISGSLEITVSDPIPEPATLILLGTGLMGFIFRSRRKK